MRSEYVTVSDQIASSTVATIKTPGNTPMNLRSGPGLQYDVIHQFSGDRYVMVLAQGNGWWHVSIDGYIGFMDSSFLTLGLHTAQDIAARNGGGAGGGSYAVVNNPKSSQALNLRQYASTASVVEAKLYNGTQLWVDEQGTEWSAVTVKNTGMSGYVMTRYLKLYNLPSRPTRRVVHPAGGSYVNLRTSPDMTYGQIAARVPTGNSVTILIPGQDWCKVTWNGYTGYMLTYFLQQ